jgi:cardiolipin synthase
MSVVAQDKRINAGDASLRPVHIQGTPGPEAPLRTLASDDLRRQALALPNLLTYLRFVAVPFFIVAFHSGRADLALWIFIGAALSDGLDGLLARVLNQRTRLGGIIDPIADKLLTLAAVATLVAHDRLPVWLLVLLLVRDGCIAGAAILLRINGRRVPASPTRLGKYSTFLLALALTLALAQAAARSSRLDGWITALLVLGAQCVIATIVQYFIRWRRLMRAPPSLLPRQE